MELYKKSYSQSGEDMIVDYIFNAKGVTYPSYLDVGANEPQKISNTYYFYEKGCNGINIEPNPFLFNKLNKIRPKDINLNIGLGKDEKVIDFYVMNSNTMSTFSKEEADKLCNTYSFEIVDVIKIPTKDVNNISDTYFNGDYPDYITIDVEGLDYEVLRTFDFKRNGANVICVETIEYAEGFNGKKDFKIIEFLKENGYLIYADTYINTIFVRNEWLRGL